VKKAESEDSNPELHNAVPHPLWAPPKKYTLKAPDYGTQIYLDSMYFLEINYGRRSIRYYTSIEVLKGVNN
jgi:hypothetical protein